MVIKIICVMVGGDCEPHIYLPRHNWRGKGSVTAIKKGARITGADRSKLGVDLKKQYDKGRSIRELADSSGRSYGFVHRVLSETGVTLRGRGGATRVKVKAKGK